MPVHARNEGSGTVEQILAVMEVEDGKAALWLVVVTRRHVDDEIALVAKEARAKLFVFAELRVGHGAIIFDILTRICGSAGVLP
jgi:hypothetical protein